MKPSPPIPKTIRYRRCVRLLKSGHGGRVLYCPPALCPGPKKRKHQSGYKESGRDDVGEDSKVGVPVTLGEVHPHQQGEREQGPQGDNGADGAYPVVEMRFPCLGPRYIRWSLIRHGWLSGWGEKSRGRRERKLSSAHVVCRCLPAQALNLRMYPTRSLISSAERSSLKDFIFSFPLSPFMPSVMAFTISSSLRPACTAASL